MRGRRDLDRAPIEPVLVNGADILTEGTSMILTLLTLIFILNSSQSPTTGSAFI